MQLLELFSGIGSQAKALGKLVETEVVGTSDIDKDTIVSYAAVHCGLTAELIRTYSEYPSKEEMIAYLEKRNIGYDFEKKKAYDWKRLAKRKTKEIHKYYLACVLSNNLGDISLISETPYADIWTYSFPCTDVSVVGKQKGIIEGNTRSGLLYEVQRLLENAKLTNELPQYLLLENVKALIGKKFKTQFEDWLKWLDTLGYTTYYSVLNAKNYGIPQTRERVFAVSVRKDLQDNFVFPTPFDNKVRLIDLLETQLDEHYFLSKKMIDGFIKHNEKHTEKGTGFIWKPRNLYGYASTLRANASLAATDNTVLATSVVPVNLMSDGTARTLKAQYAKNSNANFVSSGSYGATGVLQTFTSNGVERTYVRKLTTKECWRLMGFDDKDYEKAAALCSETQLYRQVGNSIVVDVLYYIFKNLIKG